VETRAENRKGLAQMTNKPQEHDCAVVLCCDRNFLPLSLFMIRQIAHHNPKRGFDLVIASNEALDLPDWAKPYGIVLPRIRITDDLVEAARITGGTAALLRLALAREIGARYRRILYLDSDMFVEGGDFTRLLGIDLGKRAIGAVLDAQHFYQSHHQAKEFVGLGLPPTLCFNSGLLLIDTAAFADQEIEARSYAACRAHPAQMRLYDQSMLNVALQGDFAQLAPCWNWQTNARLPLVSLRYPAFVRHFIGPTKPNKVTTLHFDARFNQAYRDHLAMLDPGQLAKLAAPADPAPMRMTEIFQLGIKHLQARPVIAAAIRRHPDPYLALH
jgi:lipopolysaccharide biosynthesis glycosyltransferase